MRGSFSAKSAGIFLLALFVPATARSFTEEEFIRQFKERNPLFQSIGLKSAITQQSETEYLGNFDTNFHFEGGYLLDQSAPENAVFGNDNREARFELGVAKRFPVGLTGDLSWETRRNTSNSPFATISPFYEPSLSLELKQNLLQNSFGLIDRMTRKTHQSVTDQTELRSRRQAEQLLAREIEVYWELVTRQSLYQTNRKFLESARRFLNSIETRKRLGTSEQTDWLGAKALLLERENALLESEARLKDAKEQVASLLQMSYQADLTGEGDPSFEYNGDLEEEIGAALRSRGDYLALKEEIRGKELSIQIAENKRYPVIDLVASLELNGLQGGLGSALEDSVTADHPTVFAGIEARYPLENRGARSSLKREQLLKKQLLLDLQDFESRLLTEVHQTYRDLQLQREQLRIHQEIRDLQAKKWKEESLKFSQGRSSSDTVIRFEREQVLAEWQSIEAGFRARLSWIRLQEAVGRLLLGEPDAD